MAHQASLVVITRTGPLSESHSVCLNRELGADFFEGARFP